VEYHPASFSSTLLGSCRPFFSLAFWLVLSLVPRP